VAAAAVGVKMFLLHDDGAAHVLVIPSKFGDFARMPQLEHQMNITRLQQQVIAKSGGQATHVVSAVYENNAETLGAAQQQIILFIGGNLTGVSPSEFIASFTDQFKGAHAVSAGPQGGSASCVSPSGERVTLCAWADGDTFGVVASSTMDAAHLSAQMRAIRPRVERTAK